jgi:hypothetical protein
MAGEEDKSAQEQVSEQGLKIREWALKTAGAIVGGLGLAGSMVVIGSAVLWTRFKEAGVPVIQAVSVQPREEALVQGAQTTAIFVLIALAAVAILYVIDAWELERAVEEEKAKRQTKAEKERVPDKVPAESHSAGKWTKRAIWLLAVGGVLWTWIWPDLGFGARILLAAIAILLAIACVGMARAESKNIWALAAAVFVSVIVFAAAADYAIVKEQKFIQSVAVLRGKEDTGLTGYYIAANGDKLWVATPIGLASGEIAIKKIDLGESVAYSVGPLQSIPDAGRTAEAMLGQLLSERDGLSGGATASLPAWLPADKAATFTGRITTKEEVAGEALCLMRYAAPKQKGKKRAFWTSCAEAEAQKTIEDARERLALPSRFQDGYEVRVKVEVPVGTKLHYAEGATAPQCGGAASEACGRRYPGGGLQYWIEDPTQLGKITLECSSTKVDQESKWEPCKS